MTSVLGYLELALLHGTLVALVVWGLERMLRERISPAWSCVLWSVALLKFLVPVTPLVFPIPGDPPVRVRFDGLVVPGGDALGPVTSSAWSWTLLVTVAYGLLVTALVARRVVAWWRLSRTVAALPLADEATLRSVREATALLGLERLPTVRIGEGPFSVGLWAPTLVLPQPAGAPSRALLVHELAHLRRRDHWVLAVQQVASVLFFFWPPVWLVNRQVAHFRELACDALALEHGEVSAPAYARMLLDAHRAARADGALIAALEMSSRSSRIERRIDMLLQLNRRRSPRWAFFSVLCGALLSLTGTALAVDAGAPARERPSDAHQGQVDRHAVERVISAHASEVVSCFEAQLVFHPQLSGTLVYDFEITADGSVGGACRGDGSTFEPAISYEAIDELTRCLGRVVKTWKFPAPKGGAADVSWPFIFKQQPVPLRSPVSQ